MQKQTPSEAEELLVDHSVDLRDSLEKHKRHCMQEHMELNAKFKAYQKTTERLEGLVSSLVFVIKHLVSESGTEAVVPLEEESKESDESVLQRAERMISQLTVSMKHRAPFVIHASSHGNSHSLSMPYTEASVEKIESLE